MVVEAVKRLADTNWDLLDEDYNVYDGEPREGEVSDALADGGCRIWTPWGVWHSQEDLERLRPEECNRLNSELEGRVQVPGSPPDKDLQNVLQGASTLWVAT